MWDFLGDYWDQVIDIATLLVACFGVAVLAGLFVRRKRELKDLLYIEQERDDFRKKCSVYNVRLNAVDPERFIDQVTEAYDTPDFDKVEKLSLAFTEKQSEAFGLAAEYLAEQRILDSETHGAEVIEEAVRFAAIGRAAFPDSKRLEELESLAQRRAEDIKRGDPIEALNMEGLTALELNQLSVALLRDGKYTLAEVAARRCVPLVRRLDGEMSANHAAALGVHAETLRLLGDYSRAERVSRKALEIRKATVGEAHPKYATVLNNFAAVLRAQGRYEEAEGFYREAMEIDKATIGEGHPNYANDLSNLAAVVEDQGRYEEAEGLYREALKIDKATIGEGHPNYATRLNNLAVNHAYQAKFQEAEDLMRQALDIREATLPPDHPDIRQSRESLADIQRAKEAKK
jgi:tetratricopeptide (TPR) repeat protein